MHRELLFLFQGGGFRLLGIQLLGFVSVASWTAITSFIMLNLINCVVPLRMPLHEEILGSDIVEHGLGDVDHVKSSLVQGQGDEENAEDVPNQVGMAIAELSHKISVAHQGAFGAKFKREPIAATSLQNGLLATVPRPLRGNIPSPIIRNAAPEQSKKQKKSRKHFLNVFRRRHKRNSFSVNNALPSTSNGCLKTVSDGSLHHNGISKPRPQQRLQNSKDDTQDHLPQLPISESYAYVNENYC